MNARVGRALRRVVDVLQRGLFDDPDPDPELPPQAETPTVAPTPGKGPSRVDDVHRHPRANREAVLDGRRVAFLLRRSRRRSIGFVVGAEGLVVSAPKWVTLRDIDAAVREKSRWILARLAEQAARAMRVEASRIVWRDGAELPYLGETICIVLDARRGLAAGEVVLDEAVPRHGAESPSEATANDRVAAPERGCRPGASPRRRLHVGLPADAGADRLRDAVQSWLQREARAVFEARCSHFAGRLGVRVTRLSLSSAATRWGSASASGAVRLHWRLIHYPLATIDYVVAHELAHLREMNHSPRFWNVVRSVLPDYEQARRELHGERLTAFE